jgi:hypothetical protein
MLKDGTMYKDLGRNHFDRRSSDQQKNRLVKRLADLGYAVEIKPLAATAGAKGKAPASRFGNRPGALSPEQRRLALAPNGGGR